MLSFNVSSDQLDELIERVEDWSYKLRDMRPFAQRVLELMADDVLTKALAGEDKDGNPLAALSEATWDWGGHQRPPGPPLVPDEFASRLIAGFEARIDEPGPDHLQVVGEWPSFPELTYHQTGYTNNLTGRWVPARDPVGLRPGAWDLVAVALDDFVDEIFALGGNY